jgi:serine/threonine-protein kinase
VDRAQYVQVSGMADRAAQQRVNQALKAPVEQDVQVMRSITQGSGTQCGKPNTVRTQARLGLAGPKMLSVLYYPTITFCSPADGELARSAVTVDLTTGRALGIDDILTPAALTPAGLQTLWKRLSSDHSSWSWDLPDKPQFTDPQDAKDIFTNNCSLHPLSRADFLPSRVQGETATDPPKMTLLFTPEGLKVFWAQAGSDQCTFFMFTAPYTSVTDLLRPEIAKLLPA